MKYSNNSTARKHYLHLAQAVRADAAERATREHRMIEAAREIDQHLRSLVATRRELRAMRGAGACK
jgi:hypothetical protein